MKRYRFASITILLLLKLFATAASAAPKFKVLHAFGDGQDGAGTWGSLLIDRKGSVYGTTSGGGIYGYGTAFELTPGSHGMWQEHILHSFNWNGEDGYESHGSLIFDDVGDLYGTTTFGGSSNYGTVFKLIPSANGWSETPIFSFDHNDGAGPYGGVAIDKLGNLYGTAGVVFELAPGDSGWTEIVIDDFPRPHDGNGPFAGVVLGHDNSLYGTTEYGGKHNLGVVYRLTLGNGGWKEQILHDFCPNGPPNCPDGATPGVGSSLAKDSDGNLYGTTVGGGCCGGVIFKLSPEANGRWKEAVLYEFQGGLLGEGPGAGVVRDKSGNLYGTTIYGGSTNCDCGVVYKLAPQKKGKWKYTILHTFVGSDGAQPDANLIIDDRGNLYGTAATGGQYNAGVAFEVTP